MRRGAISLRCRRDPPLHLLRFTIDETHYAVAIDRVIEVASRVVVTVLPGAQDFVEGLFSYRGKVCVAVSLRRRLDHPPKAPSLSDHIIVVKGRQRLLGFAVDRVHDDVVVASGDIATPTEGSRHINGVVPLQDGLLLIQDVDAMLTDDEERDLDEQIQGERA